MKILCSSQTLKIDLKGLNNERQITVGSLRLSLSLIPHLNQPISRDVYETQLSLEKARNSEKDRLFMIYAKQWWNEFLQIRPENKQRMVKIYANDELNNSYPGKHFQ